MATDFTKYDIGLDDVGFIIKPGSYSKTPIQFWANQQAEGEPSLTDASVYKFFAQTDWTGGYDEKELTAPNVFESSQNIDINRKGGEIRLARLFLGNRITNNVDLATTADSAVVTSANSTFQTDGVIQGDKLRIGSGSDAGEYTIQSVDSETQLTLTENLSTTDTGVYFIVYQDHPVLPVTTLNEGGILSAADTTITLTSVSGLPTSGTIRIEGEEIIYTGISTNDLTGCTRGANGTTASTHADGSDVEFVSAIISQIVFNNIYLVAQGKFVFSSTDADTWTLRLTASQDITDMAVSQGVLVVAAGTDGFYWSKTGTSFTGSNGGNQATNCNYICTYKPADTEYLIICYGSVFSYATYATGSPGSWTVTVKETLSSDEANFLLKPVHFRGNVYVWCNRGSETLGRSDLYVYDSTNFKPYITDSQYPKAKMMFARENDMIFAEDQGDGVAIKSFNGSAITELKKIESAVGGTQWNTVQYNTTQYGAGSELISSPFYATEFEGRFLFSLKSTSTVNYIHTYEGQDENGKESFSRIVLLDAIGTNYVSFGNFQKTIWIGDTKGRLRKMQSNYVATGKLVSSNLDVNLPNLQKLWVEAQILHYPLPQGTSISLRIADDSGGYFDATLESETGIVGSTISSFTFENAGQLLDSIANGLLSRKITYEVTLNGVSGKSPRIKDINIKYRVRTDKKHTWQITIPCLDNIFLRDETESGKSGAVWIDDLEAILAKKNIITFEDIDQTSYNVLVDDTYKKDFWIEPETGNENALYTIKLLET